jgi:predicted HTH domain antitoxin
MQIQIELPDEIAQALDAGDLTRTALEALALEGYRSGHLGGGQVQRLLGFATPMQVHSFLKEHGVFLNYSSEELEKDAATLEALLGPASEYRKRSA